jgi:hypothetical protein
MHVFWALSLEKNPTEVKRGQMSAWFVGKKVLLNVPRVW